MSEEKAHKVVQVLAKISYFFNDLKTQFTCDLVSCVNSMTVEFSKHIYVAYCAFYILTSMAICTQAGTQPYQQPTTTSLYFYIPLFQFNFYLSGLSTLLLVSPVVHLYIYRFDSVWVILFVGMRFVLCLQQTRFKLPVVFISVPYQFHPLILCSTNILWASKINVL